MQEQKVSGKLRQRWKRQEACLVDSGCRQSCECYESLIDGLLPVAVLLVALLFCWSGLFAFEASSPLDYALVVL